MRVSIKPGLVLCMNPYSTTIICSGRILVHKDVTIKLSRCQFNMYHYKWKYLKFIEYEKKFMEILLTFIKKGIKWNSLSQYLTRLINNFVNI